MKRYVVGFLFDESLTSVVLLKKNRPDWQKGFLNGFGGKIEDNESPWQAMHRESIEEIGTTPSAWLYFASMQNAESEVLFHAARDQWAFDRIQQRTDEEVMRTLVHLIPQTKALQCLHFLIPRAVYILTNVDAVKETWHLI